MKTDTMSLINKANESRAKIYYQLNQMKDLTGMSLRALKYRMIIVKQKYSNTPHLLSKVGRTWQIHHTLINEFLPKYHREQTTLFNHPWQTIMTWNTRDSYDVQYHIQLVTEIKEHLPMANIAYVVEKDGRGVNHVHAITDEANDIVEVVVGDVLQQYINKKDYRAQVLKINNVSSTVSYLRKDGGITIL